MSPVRHWPIIRILGDSLRLRRGLGQEFVHGSSALKEGFQEKNQTAYTLLDAMIWLGEGSERDPVRGLPYIDGDRWEDRRPSVPVVMYLNGDERYWYGQIVFNSRRSPFVRRLLHLHLCPRSTSL